MEPGWPGEGMEGGIAAVPKKSCGSRPPPPTQRQPHAGFPRHPLCVFNTGRPDKLHLTTTGGCLGNGCATSHRADAPDRVWV